MATMTETTTATTTKRKRPRTETSPTDNGDRRRGRPKVDKQDTSAADRRRTQIRMAQRAYRQRKESTLEELRKRVSDLTTTIELMNKSFTDFSNRFHASGLSCAQTAELEELSRRLDTLVSDARNPEDEVPSAPYLNATKTSSAAALSPNELEAADLVPLAKNVPSWIDESAVSSELNRPKFALADLGLGYALCDTETGGIEINLDGLSNMVGPPLIGAQTTSPEKITFSNAFFDDDYGPFPIPSRPSPPRTFSFQESTFARRLHRACLEKGYQLLLQPDVRPATYERVFRLSLLGRSRAKILSVMKTILARGPHEELDFWHAPLIHIGGAGTHYPPRDNFGNILAKRQSRNIGKIGPQTLALLDGASREQISVDMTVEIAGYEGEWFDPNDVQGYLEERGFLIDATSTFAEGDMIVEAEESNGISSASSAMSNGMQEFLNEADGTPWGNFFGGASLTNVGFSDAQTGSFMNFLQPGESINRPPAPQHAIDKQSFTWSDDWIDPMSDVQDLSLVPLTPAALSGARTKKVVLDVRKLIKGKYCRLVTMLLAYLTNC